MKLTRLIPIASLTTVCGVALAALVLDGPPDFPFTEPPAGEAPPAPELGIEDGVLFGRIVDLDGAPVLEAGVTSRGGPRPTFARTRADGTFELDGLSEGGGRVLVLARGFDSLRVELDAWPESSAEARFEIALEKAIAPAPDPEGLALLDLEGRVTFGPLHDEDGRYELYFLPEIPPDEAEGGFPRRADVEPSGSFFVPGLQVGAYRVILLGPEDRGGVAPDLLAESDGTPRTIQHGGGDGVSLLALVANAGAARGVVRRAGTEEGPAPTVRGAFVRFERILEADADGAPIRTDATHFRATRTGSDGTFVARDLAPGRYRVSVYAGRSTSETTLQVEPRAVAETTIELGPDARAARSDR